MKTCRKITWLIVSLMTLLWGLGNVQAKELSEAESKRLGEIITEAKEARTKGDLERVTDLLRQAIDINPAPSFRWNLARIYEDLCRYPGAAEQFKVLETDKAVNQELRDKAKLRLRGLERYLAGPSYRVRPQTEGALIYLNGTKVKSEANSQLLDEKLGGGPAGQTYFVELHTKGSFRTRIRAFEASLERCVTIDDDLDASIPELGLIRINPAQPIASLELHSGLMRRLRIRADLSQLRELELPGGEYKFEGRTTNGDLVSGNVSLTPGAVVEVSLMTNAKPGQPVAASTPAKPLLPELVTVEGGHSVGADTWGWVTTGASAALLATGIWARIDADRLFDQYTKVWNETVVAEQESEEEIWERYRTIIRRETTAWVLVGIGAAGAVAGTVMLLNGGTSTKGTVEHLGSSFSISPGLDGSVHMQLRF